MRDFAFKCYVFRVPEPHTKAKQASRVGHEGDDGDLLVPHDPGDHGVLDVHVDHGQVLLGVQEDVLLQGLDLAVVAGKVPDTDRVPAVLDAEALILCSKRLFTLGLGEGANVGLVMKRME